MEEKVPTVTLPTAKAPKVTELSRQRILIYGPAKIGKSTWCSRAEDTLFLDCENGLQSIEAFKVPCVTWGDIVGAVQAIKAGGHNYKTVVVDTVGAAYLKAQQYVLKKHKGTEWLNDGPLAYGKGRGITTNSIIWLLQELSAPALGLGLYLVAHEKQEQVPDNFGGERIRTGPDLHESIVQYVIGWADMVLHCGYESTAVEGAEPTVRRRLQAQGSDYLVAGDRTGLLPASMDLSFPAFKKTYLAALMKGKESKKGVKDAEPVRA